MTDSPDPKLEELAEQLSDGEALAWDALRAADPARAGEIDALYALERLARAHRAGRGDADASVHDLETAPVALTWGLLRALDKLGEGSFGEVWRAYDPSLHREVALKLRRADALSPGLPARLTRDPRTRRWLDEARRLARVRHPNVLVVHGAAEHDGRVGMWTEFVRGETLEERLQRQGPFAPRELARIAIDLCSALAAVHATGLVHGDVKAANVMLEPGASGRPRVVLMDFGAAHGFEGRRGGTLAVGTPLLMAPELLRGEPATPASDLYALGTMLQQLLTSHYPIEADSWEALQAAHASGASVPLARARPELPGALVRVIERACSSDPAQRYASATAMREALLTYAAPSRARGVRIIAAAVTVALVASGIAWHELRKPSVDRTVPPQALQPASDTTIAMRWAQTLLGPDANGSFGVSACGVGDVNGDGHADVVIGSRIYSGTHMHQGCVSLYFGSDTGLVQPPAWTAYGTGDEHQMGIFCGLAGDVNGDGIADLAVSELQPRASDNAWVEGVRIFFGRKGGFADSSSWYGAYGPSNGSDFGNLFASAGDVDGDGCDDLLLGNPLYSGRYANEGAVWLFRGSKAGLMSEPSWHVTGGSPNANLGWWVTHLGDVNGDHYADILVGGSHFDGPEGGEGRAQVFYGGPHGPDTTAAWTMLGSQANSAFGWSIGGGDWNADGFADVLVGETNASRRALMEGRVLVYAGSAHGMARVPSLVLEGQESRAHLGTGGIDIAGDVDGDGVPDLIAATPYFSGGSIERGQGLFVLAPGSREAAPRPRAWWLAGATRHESIVSRAFPVGDVNGDGLADVLLTAPSWPSAGDRRGRVVLLEGRRGR